MSKTIHRDKYTIRSRNHHVEEDDWNQIFKRDKQNTEKNRYRRKQKNDKH